MNLKSIATFMESKLLGRMGESIFIGEMPLEAKSGILLIDTYAGTPIDHELPGWRDTGFRMVFRGTNYEETEGFAERVSAVMTIKTDTPMIGMLMRQCLPKTDPLPYRRSKGSGTWEFEVDVECIYIKR